MSFLKDLWKLWQHKPSDKFSPTITDPEFIPDIKPKPVGMSAEKMIQIAKEALEKQKLVPANVSFKKMVDRGIINEQGEVITNKKTIWCVYCDEDILFPGRTGVTYHFELFHSDRSCSICGNKKKDQNENLSGEMRIEINCPNCGMISYIGSVRDGETKTFHCEAGEASCGWTWNETFKLENFHDYDIENFRKGLWEKTNLGGKDKNTVIKRAQETATSFAHNKTDLGKMTNGVRVVDREDNIFFEWIRNGEDDE